MSLQIVGIPTLILTYSPPNLSARKVGVQSAQWNGHARVKVKDEQGKKWRIGFVQVLHKNTMIAVYKKTKKSEVLKTGDSLPILDGPDEVTDRPFYDGPPETKNVNMLTTAAPGTEVTVETEMFDEPESDYKWYYNEDPTDPLEEFVMYLTFSTYIAARDVTAGTVGPMNMHFLYQWDVVLDRRYKFNVVRNGTTLPLKADLTQTKWTVENPTRQPFITKPVRVEEPASTLLSGKVANQVFKDDITTVGAIQVGEGVKSLASKFGGIGHFKKTP